MIKLKNFLKRFVLSCLVFILVSFSLAPRAYAQADTGKWFNQSFGEWYGKVYGSPENEIFGERYTAAQIDWIIWGALSWLPTKIVGPDLITCVVTGDVSGCVKDLLSSGQPLPDVVQSQQETNPSLLSSVFEERSLSGITYIKNRLRHFSLIPEAQAQQPGFGFSAFMPVLSLWRASRNLAYALFVLVSVVISFMIMFRVKISPQVVISVQSALPKLFIALILVTFSYAIAGFLVDLMYVAIGLVSLIGRQFFPIEVSPTTIFNFLTKGQPWNINVQGGVFSLYFVYLILFVIGAVLVLFMTFGLLQSAIIGALVGLLGSLVASTGLGTLVGLALLVVMLLVLLWMGIKTFWTLLKAYASLLLLTIFSPLYITLGIIVPSLGFGNWLKNFVSNLAVFIVTGALFLLSFIFLFQGVVIAGEKFIGNDFGSTILNVIFGTSSTQAFSNLFGESVNVAWPPLLGVGDVGVALLLLGVSFVLFTLIPKSSEIIQALIQGKPFAYGTAIGEAFGGVGLGYGLTLGGPVRAIREQAGAVGALRTIESVLARVPGLRGSRFLQDVTSGLTRRATGEGPGGGPPGR